MNAPRTAAAVAESKRAFRESAFVIVLADGYFAGFHAGVGIDPTPRIAHGLCDAKLIGGSNPNKVRDYISRLEKMGVRAKSMKVCIEEQA